MFLAALAALTVVWIAGGTFALAWMSVRGLFDAWGSKPGGFDIFCAGIYVLCGIFLLYAAVDIVTA